jgi:hypothetical protein
LGDISRVLFAPKDGQVSRIEGWGRREGVGLQSLVVPSDHREHVTQDIEMNSSRESTMVKNFFKKLLIGEQVMLLCADCSCRSCRQEVRVVGGRDDEVREQMAFTMQKEKR